MPWPIRHHHAVHCQRALDSALLKECHVDQEETMTIIRVLNLGPMRPTSSFLALSFFTSHMEEAVSESPQLGLHPGPPPRCCSLPGSNLLPASHSHSSDQTKAVCFGLTGISLTLTRSDQSCVIWPDWLPACSAACHS